MQEEPEQHERISQIRVKVENGSSRVLLQLAEIARVKDQMREITERLGSSVVKIGEVETHEKTGDRQNGGGQD